MILVAFSTSKSKLSAKSSSNSWTPSSHSGKLPPLIASHRSRRWKSGSAPLILTASFHITDCRPCLGFQWNLTKVERPDRKSTRLNSVTNAHLVCRLLLEKNTQHNHDSLYRSQH